MPGPTPKPSHLRQRTNSSSTRAQLPSEADSLTNEVPDLPESEEGWHPMVRAWWADVWRSPMASEYLEADKRGLYRLAMLEQDFWSATKPSQRIAASIEIRLVGQAFGLSPIDRRRLQWEVERGEQAAAETEKRRTPKPQAEPAADPRAVLKVS